MNKENIFQKSAVFRFIILLMILSNIVYVSIEINKSQISNSLVKNAEITELTFTKLATLSNYALTFETAFFVLSLVGVVMMFIKMYRLLLLSYIVIQLAFLTSMLALNNILAWAFNAPTGNMSQLLYAPFGLWFVVLIYFVVKNTVLKKAWIDDKLSH